MGEGGGGSVGGGGGVGGLRGVGVSVGVCVGVGVAFSRVRCQDRGGVRGSG